jgi:glycosyltransferase involved in cell wall biosynthesis
VRFKLAYFATHPIQYQAPMLRHLAADSRIELEAFFYSDFSVHQHVDPGYGVKFKWDVPLVEGYKYHFLERWGGRERSRSARLPARGLKRALRDGKFHAVWVHGWAHACSLQAMQAARSLGLPVLLRGDSVPDRLCASGMRPWWVRWSQQLLLRCASAFLCSGSTNREFYRQRGIPLERLFWMPYAVDNEFFQRKATEASPRREALRAELGLKPGRLIVLFTGRLSSVKAPETLLEAFRLAFHGSDRHDPLEASDKRPHLLFVGEGPMRAELEETARSLPDGTVHFLGFRNQTELPAFYDLCDLFVLPSRFEPWGLVINEVMNAARPIIVSDRAGAAKDLVQADLNGWTFPSGDTSALATYLRQAVADPTRLQRMGRESLKRINPWDFEADRNGLIDALTHTVH